MKLTLYLYLSLQNGPSTKDNEHFRPSMGLSSGYPGVKIDVDLLTPKNQHAFLSNETNEICFIDLLIPLLVDKGWKVSRANGNADSLIVAETLDLVCMKDVVFGEDTDIKVMLLHSVNSEMWQITISPFGTKKQRINPAILISNCQHQKRIAQYLLVIHAFSGCDTTSVTYDLGKPSLLKLVKESSRVKDLCAVFMKKKVEIGSSGVQLFLLL